MSKFTDNEKALLKYLESFPIRLVDTTPRAWIDCVDGLIYRGYIKTYYATTDGFGRWELTDRGRELVESWKLTTQQNGGES